MSSQSSISKTSVVLLILGLIIGAGGGYFYASSTYQSRSHELEQNKALVEQYFEAWSEGDFEAMGEILDTDYHFEMLNLPISKMNREEMIGFAMLMHSSFPDLKINIQQTIAEEDIVVLRAIWTGTHEGEEWYGIPPTGNKVEFTTIVTFRIEDGKIVEEKEMMDAVAFDQGLRGGA